MATQLLVVCLIYRAQNLYTFYVLEGEGIPALEGGAFWAEPFVVAVGAEDEDVLLDLLLLYLGVRAVLDSPPALPALDGSFLLSILSIKHSTFEIN